MSKKPGSGSTESPTVIFNNRGGVEFGGREMNELVLRQRRRFVRFIPQADCLRLVFDCWPKEGSVEIHRMRASVPYNLWVELQKDYGEKRFFLRGTQPNVRMALKETAIPISGCSL